MTTATTIAARRARVAKYLDDGVSQRDIARALGVTKDTVHRDAKALARAASQDSPSPRPSSAPPRRPARHRPRHRLRRPRHDRAIPAPASPTPDPNPATVSRDTVATPSVPCVAMPLTPDLLADLGTLTQTGATPTAALRHAVATVAATYRQAWSAGLYPPTATPVVARLQFAPYKPTNPETAPAHIVDPATRRPL
ncbi:MULTISPECIES: helix-turn-helix domain-containing protein [unclassified Streptomyces]|uniref:helix-turn-helix domain-containing protein n=1 Tax=unclassified Streptomyces TaxID=2593676 RepID=UPI001661044C|nr:MULTISPECIES: helix-turn-helix domain-containing protein [unclassified Streptomyces]MBD0707379.1 hypothetical protein [Streptomyces sp. CBMA291]MBD0715169.1 hypothetical protein [Streptomyces sp. CBMA370]